MLCGEITKGKRHVKKDRKRGRFKDALGFFANNSLTFVFKGFPIEYNI